MTVWFAYEKQPSAEANNAAPKARADVDSICMEKMQIKPLVVGANRWKRVGKRPISKVLAHLSAYIEWSKAVKRVSAGDVLILQFPPRNHSLFLGKVFKKIKKKSVSLVYLIHDLDTLRYRNSNLPNWKQNRMKREELSLIPLGDRYISHNNSMSKALESELSVSSEDTISLGIFDYLVPKRMTDVWVKASKELPIVIAGNLDPKKAGYVYKLPSEIRFNLYGPGYKDESSKGNLNFCGSYPPDKLLRVLEGSFGLIWDGDSIETCSGSYGDYLRINNPHKTSLYLACGLPIIIWKESALSEFVNNERVGLCVDCISSIPGLLNSITEDEYEEMVNNARRVGKRLRSGEYTQSAVAASLSSLEE